MKNPPRRLFRSSYVARRLWIRAWWLVFLTTIAQTPINAQITGIQDVFNYTTSDINGHALSMGTGKWTTNYYGPSNSISASGSQAVISTNGGVAGGGSAIASIPFTPNPNTVYTLTTTLKFNGPTDQSCDCWAGVGFSSVTGGGNKAQNNAPWILIRPQATATDNPQTAALIGTHWINSANVASGNYSAPIAVTLTWNTNSGVTEYFINNTLQCTGTTAVPSGQYYPFFQAFQTGTAVNVLSTTVSAQALSYEGVTMQDNFTNISSSIGGQAPGTVMGSGWSANWLVNTSNATISTSGSQALIVTASGVSGSNGNAVASYPFTASPNTFYTIRAALSFTGTIGSGPDCWGALGFSNSTSGGNTSQNNAPWMLIRPQGVSTDNPQTADFIGSQNVASGTTPAAYYSGPITATVTWNTATGETKYYVNDLLQATGTSSLPNGAFYGFFQGYQTGAAVNINTIVLTAQQLPLPEMWFAPNDFPINFATIIETGTTPCGWATAKTHTNVFSCYNTFFWQSGTPTQWATLISYLKQNNIKLAVCTNPLLKGTNSCTTVEGYDTPYSNTWALQTIVALGGTIDYLTLDSPLGNCEFTGTCNLPIATAAQQTANTIALYKAVFPNIKVIDFDGFAGFPAADNAAWFSDLRALGEPLDGIMDDFNWYLNYTAQLPAAAAACATAGVSYGLFSDGFSGVAGSANNPAQYALGMLINAQSYNASASPNPSRLCVASWTSPATITCPETTPTTLAALINLSLTSPYVMQTPPVALYCLWNNSNSNLYTSSYTQYLNWIALGYLDSGVLGGLAQKPTIGGMNGLVPIYVYYNSSKQAYALSLGTADSGHNGNKYYLQSSLGYVFPPSTGAAAGGVALYEFYKQVVDQYIYSTNPTVPGGFTSNGVVAYLLPGFFHNSYLH